MPFGIDPRTSFSEGIFTIPVSKLVHEATYSECIPEFTIGHLRDSEGYNKTWFDEDKVDKTLNNVAE